VSIFNFDLLRLAIKENNKNQVRLKDYEALFAKTAELKKLISFLLNFSLFKNND
jgi:hypothetical protein